jgi:predicted MFS family arabinose efflux permease
MEVVSGAGDGVFWVGLVAVMLDDHIGAAGFAAAVLARLAPRALLSAATTALVERLPVRRTLVGLDLARAICMIVLGVLAVGEVSPWVMLAPVAIAYTFAAPYRPLVTGALPAIVPERDLSTVNARVSTVRQLMTFIGPLVGTLVVGVGDPTACFAFNAVSFVIAGLLLVGLRDLDRSVLGPDHAPSDRQGWRTALDTPGVRGLIVLVGAMYLVRGAELVLFALLSEQLDIGAGGIGVLSGAVGLGALVAMPLSSRWADAMSPLRLLGAASVATVVPLVVMAFSSSIVVVCVALVVLGGSIVVFEVVSVVTLQRLAPTGALARVFGLVATSSNAGKLIGALAAPVLVVSISLEGAFIAVAVVVAATSIGCAPAVSALSERAAARRTTLRPTVDALASLGLFDGASRASLERLAGLVTEEAVAAGEVVIREGADADDLFVVRDGVFDAFIRGQVANTVTSGSWFGEIGLLQRVPRTATVVARTDGTVWRIPGEEFLAALTDVASMPAALLTEMSERLRRTAAITDRPA